MVDTAPPPPPSSASTPLLDVASLHVWFSTSPAASRMLAAGYVGPTLEVTKFSFGQSNPTFLVHDVEGVRVCVRVWAHVVRVHTV